MKANSQTLFTSMTSLLLVVMCLLISTLGVKAQDAVADQTKFGIRGGLILGMNASQINGDDYIGFHKVGLNGGFYAQVPVSKKFFFSTEILYSQKGAKSPTYQGIPIQFSWALHYAEIPVLFHFQEKKAVNFGLGFSYSRLLKEKLIADGEPQPSIPVISGRPNDVDLFNSTALFLHRSDFNILADANYLPTRHLAINVRYAYSLVPLGYYGGSNFINRGMYLNMLSFRLMWVFGGGQAG